MAYFAVISVIHTIQRLFNSSRISTVSSSLQIIQSAYDEVKSLQQVLRRLDGCRSSSRRKRMDALDAQIWEAVSKLEDVIESHLSNYFHSGSEEGIGDGSCSVKLFSVDEGEIQTLVEAVKKMKEEYSDELGKPSVPEEDNYAVSSRPIDFGEKKSSIVRYYGDELTKMKNQLMESKTYEFRIVSAVGDGCTTQTIFAKLVCKKAVSQSFEICAMVTIGREYKLKDILIDILSQVDVDEHYQKLQIWEEGGEKYEKLLGKHLFTCLKGSRYLIMLDGIWETEVWKLLSSSFPKYHNGSRIFLTTSVMEVAQFADTYNIYELNILSKDESWDLIRELDPSSCPPYQAEEISLIQLLLSEAYDEISENTTEENSVFEDEANDDERFSEENDLEQKIAGDSKFQKFTNCLSSTLATILSLCNPRESNSVMQLGNSCSDNGGVDVFSRTDSAETIQQMLGLVKYVDHIMFVDAHPHGCYGNMNILSLFGMAGIGKTTLAREIFDDPSISGRFDLRVWITLGPDYQSENILADILAQIDPDIDKMHMMKGDEMLAEHFWTKASRRRCLFVLDDVWSEDPLYYVHKLFNNFKFEALVTTRLNDVALFVLDYAVGDCRCYKMRLLNNEESWHLLCENVFAEKSCPRELEEAGKVIAEKCDGLPLLIDTVASFLSEEEKTPENWTKAAKKYSLVFEHAYEKISDMLYPSYECLPQFLKACFLYMAAFPRKYEIPTSRLLKLWSFEDIIDPELWDFELQALYCVRECISRSLLLEGKKSSNVGIKTTELHSVYWHLCVREARKVKFFHVLNRYSDCFGEYIKDQRRLCIQNNVVFGLKDVHDSMACLPSARSLLCTGPPHPYQVPICLGLELLKVVDALTIRFYEFPIEVLNLVLLRYFGLTYDGKLPPSISKLRNLECLIVRRHLHIKLYGAPSYLPKEIWDMKELKHLQVMGSNLPDPCGAVLPNLATLLDLSAQSVIEGVLRGTPNLMKLGIRIELTPDASDPVFSFDLYHLDRLESLKCVVVNPELIRSGVVASTPPIRSLPSSLKKLSLSGLGYPWKEMETIARLPNLEVLKLRCYAFSGPEWVMNEGEFRELRYLLLEDTDLEHLKTHDGWFYGVRRLIIRHCYKLKKFPGDTRGATCDIELVDCSTSASKFLLDNKYFFAGNAYSSWEKQM